MKNRILAFIIITFSLWLAKLFFLGELAFYILPKYNILIFITSITLFLLSMVLLVKGSKFTTTKHHVSWRYFILLTIPCVLGFSFSPVMLSSSAALQRGIQTDISTVKISTPLAFSIDSAQRSFSDWINILESTSNIQKYAGEEVHISGFVLRNTDTEENEFFLSRFILRCCAADARPVAIKVVSSEVVSWKNDEWLEVNGILQNSPDETGVLEIKMTSSHSIEIPPHPYIN